MLRMRMWLGGCVLFQPAHWCSLVPYKPHIRDLSLAAQLANKGYHLLSPSIIFSPQPADFGTSKTSPSSNVEMIRIANEPEIEAHTGHNFTEWKQGQIIVRRKWIPDITIAVLFHLPHLPVLSCTQKRMTDYCRSEQTLSAKYH